MVTLLSASFAGLVAIGVTVAIERWGGRVGGLIGTVPSTIVPATIGIGHLSADPDAFAAAMYMTPVGMWVNGVFLWTWKAPFRSTGRWANRLSTVLIASLSAWAALAWAAVEGAEMLHHHGLGLSSIALVATAALLLAGVATCRGAPPSPAGHQRVGRLVLLARGVLAASAIGVAVTLAEVGSPLTAGMAAVFPAIFLTTMVSLWVSQGEAVQIGAVGPMILGGTSVSVFALLAAWMIPTWGMVAGCSGAWFIAVGGITLPAWLWLRPTPSSTGD